MRTFGITALVVGLSLVIGPAALAAEPKPAEKAAVAPAAKCAHGVKKAICARCNPKLAPVFKAKNDWCGEHDHPESQCALCNPHVAREGVK